MSDYTNEEYADMHLIYGRAGGNGRLAQRMYQEQYPRRCCPHHTTFTNIDRRLRETGTFQITRRNAGQERSVRTPDTENRVLQRFADSPSTSTRSVAAELGIRHEMVWKVLRAAKMHPFHVQKVQLLADGDYPLRVEFVRWMLDATQNDSQFPATVLFSDEACFTREGVVNTHNAHMWSSENPHITVSSKVQHRFSINIWAGILGDHLLGPYLLPERLNGAKYLVFLQHVLPDLLQGIPATVRQNMLFMHDGAPAHFSIAVRNHLDATYPGRWIGRGGPVAWPPRSPDLNPLDFFFWGHLKSLVYQTPVDTLEDLTARIVVASADIASTPGMFERVRQSFVRRCRLCNDLRGRTFEQFL